MTDLSHTAVANGELASALVVGLLLSGPAGSITAGAPGGGSGPAVSGARTGRPGSWTKTAATESERPRSADCSIIALRKISRKTPVS